MPHELMDRRPPPVLQPAPSFLLAVTISDDEVVLEDRRFKKVTSDQFTTACLL